MTTVFLIFVIRDTDDEDDWLPNEEPIAMTTRGDDARHLFDQINECFGVA